jgi:hypothetical protein
MRRPRPGPALRLPPLRAPERVLAGYATVAFGIGAAGSVMHREWTFAAIGTIMAAAGVALLLHDHRQWRAVRRSNATSRPR